MNIDLLVGILAAVGAFTGVSSFTWSLMQIKLERRRRRIREDYLEATGSLRNVPSLVLEENLEVGFDHGARRELDDRSTSEWTADAEERGPEYYHYIGPL